MSGAVSGCAPALPPLTNAATEDWVQDGRNNTGTPMPPSTRISKMFLLKVDLLGVIINHQELCTLQVIKANVGLTRCQLMVPH